jgi:hypothetical protein
MLEPLHSYRLVEELLEVIGTVKTRYKNMLGTEVHILMKGYSYVGDAWAQNKKSSQIS